MYTGRPRVFKNYIETNANQLRTKLNSKKIQMAEDRARIEKDIQEAIANPGAMRGKNRSTGKMIRATQSISRLMAQTTSSSKAFKQPDVEGLNLERTVAEMLSRQMGKLCGVDNKLKRKMSAASSRRINNKTQVQFASARDL